MSALLKFLARNNITKTNPLPVVHTTEAFHLKKILRTGSIETRPCDVFAGEQLTYFFVGRAAYKSSLREEPEYWELPVCFVFEYFIDGAKRVFPFDSGAFSRGRFPNFINMMDLDEFEASGDSEAPSKLIGTFFGSSSNYYRLIGRSAEKFEADFDVGVLDEEIKALHRVISTKGRQFDDRRFTIELSFDDAVDMGARKLIAIVLPEVYITDERFFSELSAIGAEIITYPIYPLRSDYYYYVIYQKLEGIIPLTQVR